MKALKHIYFCLFLLLIIPLLEDSNLVSRPYGILASIPRDEALKTYYDKKFEAINNYKKENDKLAELQTVYQMLRELKSGNPPLEQSKLIRQTYWIKDYNKNSLSNLLVIISIALVLIIADAIINKLATQVENPPASFVSKIADLLPKKYRQSLLQEISDMRLEYYEALSEKKFWRAKCIVAFYYIGLSWSVVIWISDKAKEVVGLLPTKN